MHRVMQNLDDPMEWPGQRVAAETVSPAATRSATNPSHACVPTARWGRLERAGLVTRVPSKQDERGVNVTLSPKGASVLERVLPGHVEVVRDVLVDALDGADRHELTRLLGRVVQHMRSRPPRSARRSTAGGADS
jgi:hypothetical protein